MGEYVIYHRLVQTPNVFRFAGRLFALAFISLAAAACGSPTQAASSASSPASSASSPASSGSAHVSADERRAVLAFSGTYQVKSVVTATTGTYGESVGAVHFYTWQAVPDCDGQSCAVKVTSSTGSQTVFTYSNGKFLGSGHGSAMCFDVNTGTPTGSAPSTLQDTLLPAMTSSPITSLTGVVHLAVAALCGGSGTGTFSYTLTRTASVSPGVSSA
ncbi:MAG TPA: hypothetical protein VF060_34785 [Trebonia sp.]